MLFDTSLQKALNDAIKVAEEYRYPYVREYSSQGVVRFEATFNRQTAIVGVNIGVDMSGKLIPGRESKIQLVDRVYRSESEESGGV